MRAKNCQKKKLIRLAKPLETFFLFRSSVRNKLKLRSFVNIWMVEDRIQDLDSATCGILQIYFYENLFNPDENSKIQGETKLKTSTVEMLLNKLFSLDDRENEIKMEEYADKIGVKISV